MGTGFRKDAILRDRALGRGGGETRSVAAHSNQARSAMFQERSPGPLLPLGFATVPPSSNLRANLTRQQIDKAWQDRGGNMATASNLGT